LVALLIEMGMDTAEILDTVRGGGAACHPSGGTEAGSLTIVYDINVGLSAAL